MPLLIPNRPPNPFALQRRRSNLPGQYGQDSRNTRPGGTDTLRLYPLEVAQSRPERRVQPQNQRRQPRTPVSSMGRGNASPIAPPEYTMAPPQHTPHSVPRNSNMPQTMSHNSNTSPATQRPAAHSTAGRPGNHADIQQSPEQAAQHFRRTNKGLPDGVRYEPLDENTMRLLRENGHLPPLEPPPTPAQPIQPPMAQSPAPSHMPQSPLQPPTISTPLPPPAMPDTQAIAKIIEGLVQDERNAQIFYGHLSKIAPAGHIATALSDIANDNISHTHKFTQLLTKQFGNNFTPAEAEINTGLELKDALALALGEENKTLRVLAGLLEDVANTESEKVIQRVINKKIVNYHQLERLYTLS